jgi:hypothetical protein
VTGTLSNRHVRRMAAAAGIGAGASLGMSGVAQAADFTVGTLVDADTSADSNCFSTSNIDCTLRDAILISNSSVGVADTISFRSGLTGTITLGSDLPKITSPVSIDGPGADLITINGATHRIFDVKPANPGDPVLISGLTLTGAGAVGSTTDANRGGAVLNETGDLTLADSIITGNTTSDYAPGIYSGCDTNCGAAVHGVGYDANLTLTRMTVSDNTSTGSGGGAMYLNYGSATITSSTIEGNSAVWSGGIGIFYMQGPVSIENTTITGNSTTGATGQGGGVYVFYNPSGVTIENSTIAGNTAVSGAGVYDADAAVSPPRIAGNVNPVLKNTIVAGNSGPDLGGHNAAAFDSAFSLIGTISGASVNETVAGSDVTGANPMLGPLAGNGGPTETMLPLAGSPAIDKGCRFGATTDQRSLTRPVDLPDYNNSAAVGADGSDIGASELQTSPGGGDATGTQSPGSAICPPSPPPSGTTTPPGTTPPAAKKKCKKKKHKRSAQSSKKKCKKKRK